EKITDAVWNSLWEEWQDRRRAIRERLEGLEHKIDTHIEHLDQALTIVAKVGVLFEEMARSEQKALLREMVERVIIDPDGTVLRLELLPPFAYLHRLTQQVKGKHNGRTTKTSSAGSAGSCSMVVSSGGPEGRRFKN
ncbi:MAG: hypothetical protein SF029_14550, partial [bacterium]|nr:hypothetical protein [bacterium]